MDTSDEPATAETHETHASETHAPDTAEATGVRPAPVIPPDSMVQQMQMQLVLDHPRVRPYLHTELANNLPLTVYAVGALADGVSALTAGGRGVRVVAEGGARVRFTAREDLEGPRVRIRFAIPAEGVSGAVDLELADYTWRAIDADVVEQ